MFLTDIHSLGPGRAGRHHVHRRLVLELRRREPGVRRPVPGQDRHPADLRARRQLLRRACSTWRRSRRPAPTTPTPWSSSWRARRSTTSSCATARSAPRTTGSIHDAYLAQVKPPAEVTEPWDYEKILKTIPAAEAFRAPVRRLQDVTGDDRLPAEHVQRAGERGVLRPARPRPRGHLRHAAAWSTSPTARSTCSARSGRTSCCTESGVPFWVGAGDRAGRAGRASAWCWSGPADPPADAGSTRSTTSCSPSASR